MTFYGEDFRPKKESLTHINISEPSKSWEVGKCSLHGNFSPQLVGHRCPDCLRLAAYLKDLDALRPSRLDYQKGVPSHNPTATEVVQLGNRIGKRTVTDFLMKRHLGIVPEEEFKSKMLSDFVPWGDSRVGSKDYREAQVALNKFYTDRMKDYETRVLGKFKDNIQELVDACLDEDTVAIQVDEYGNTYRISRDEFWKKESAS